MAKRKPTAANIKGKTQPRIYTPPLRKLTPSTSLGYAAADYAEQVLGKTLYPWQRWALIHALEIIGSLGKSWHFRFRTILIMVARQNGKTVLSEIIASFFANVLRVEAIFGTSLSLDKAEEVWEAVVRDQQDIPDLAEELQRVARTNGSKKLYLTGGRTYKVGAPTRRAGRGDSNDLVMLDEIREHRDWETWSAAIASTNAKPNGLVLCFSNAGDPDSIVLRQIRALAIQAIDGTDAQDFGGADAIDADTLALYEWSADPEASVDDIQGIAQANPALGYGQLTLRAIAASRQTFPINKYRSECLCQQVDTLLPPPFPAGAWAAGTDETSTIDAASAITYGIDLSAARTYTTIAAAGIRPDGEYHIEVIARRAGTEWAIDWIRERAARAPMTLAFQSRGAPVAGLAEQICTLPGVTRAAIEGPELTAGWGRFYDAIASMSPDSPNHSARGKIYHLPQPVLDTPAKTMQVRQLGGGVTLPDRTKSPDDIAPLFSCIMAYTAATSQTASKTKTAPSAYQAGAPLVFI